MKIKIKGRYETKIFEGNFKLYRTYDKWILIFLAVAIPIYLIVVPDHWNINVYIEYLFVAIPITYFFLVIVNLINKNRDKKFWLPPPYIGYKTTDIGHLSIPKPISYFFQLLMYLINKDKDQTFWFIGYYIGIKLYEGIPYIAYIFYENVYFKLTDESILLLETMTDGKNWSVQASREGIQIL